jgi:hypothetical protein
MDSPFWVSEPRKPPTPLHTAYIILDRAASPSVKREIVIVTTLANLDFPFGGRSDVQLTPLLTLIRYLILFLD